MKKCYILIILLSITCSNLFAASNVFIVTTVNDNILTNLDIEKEVSYLKLLNPQLKELGEKKLFKIAKNSLINEIIKKKEAKKFFKFDLDSKIINDIYKDFLNNLGFSSDKEFEKVLLKNNSYNNLEIKEKMKIEFFWNRIILDKFNDKVKIDKEKFLQKIQNINELKSEYLLSEIFFYRDKNLKFNEQLKIIKKSIEEIGFNNTASIHSVSESANFGGKIGWVEEDSLSKKIVDALKNITIGEYTNVIQFRNSNLILKIEDKKIKKVNSNKDQALKKMIMYETNKQLNQFSNIYFNKVKINFKINDK